jgi:molecular chaperone GrpE
METKPQHPPDIKTTISKTTFVSIRELEKLKKELEEEKKKSNEYLSRLKYLQADFENLQKRTRKEVEDAIESGSQALIVKFLPVLDDLERALTSARESKDKEAVLDGVELILKEVQTTLYEAGLVPIESVEKKFDTSLHEAIGYVETANQPDGIITRELRKGYRVGDRVIRHSMVEVSRSPKSQ